jgi:hypothetical protein
MFWLFAPPSMISLFFFIYFLIGPLSALALDKTIFVGADMRTVFLPAWLVGNVGLLAIWIGYYSPIARLIIGRKRLANFDLNRFHACGLVLTFVGCMSVILWIALSGSVLDILGMSFGIAPRTAFQEAPRWNYFYLGMSLVFVGVFIQLALRRISILVALAFLLPLCLVFVSIGFRYRLVFVLGGMTLLMHMRRSRPPRPSVLAVITLSLLIAFGLMGLTRQYNRGLDVARLSELSWEDIYLGSLSDTNTFFALGAVMDVVPRQYSFVGFDPIYYALILPIPRVMWEAKPAPEYLELIPAAIGTEESKTAGVAWPFLAECYVTFGWLGVISLCLAFGVTCRVAWIAYCRAPKDPAMMVIYSLTFPLIYYVLSRGYLAQILSDFCATLLPALIAQRLCRSRGSIKRAPHFVAVQS